MNVKTDNMALDFVFDSTLTDISRAAKVIHGCDISWAVKVTNVEIYQIHGTISKG